MERPDNWIWWQHGVIYHVYLRSFQDSDGDGVGDLRGLYGRLGYIADLGVDAVWVSPFYASPKRDWGYDVSDHIAIDPAFGTMADWDGVTQEAERLGLRLIVDWIPNHTSSDHEWFAESRSSRENPKADWYVWADASESGGPPTNWPSAFGGSAWTWAPEREQYYLHLCLPSMPDLNWHNPAVESAMFDTARFWLDRGASGLRVDVAHWIGKSGRLNDHDLDAGGTFVNAAKAFTPFESAEHTHDMDGPLAHAVYRRLRTLLDQRQAVALGEIHLPPERWSTYFGPPDAPELHLPQFFGLLGAAFTTDGIASTVDDQLSALPPHGWPSWVWGNHDEPRLASRIGPGRTRLAALLLLTLPGTPTLYAGDEIGTPSLDLAPADSRDPLAGQGTGRDAGRSPMRWTPAPNGGFCPDAVAPWLPLSAGPSVAEQETDSGSLLHLYRDLLSLRRAHPALHRGTYQRTHAPDGTLAYERTDGSERLRIVLNLSDAPASLPPGRVLLATHAVTDTLPSGAGVILQP